MLRPLSVGDVDVDEDEEGQGGGNWMIVLLMK
jgi:hypothetical protein